MLWWVLFAVYVWLAGAVASCAAQRELGLANPDTIHDSFSGDDGLDLLCIVLWPVFWPLWLVHRTTVHIIRKAAK